MRNLDRETTVSAAHVQHARIRLQPLEKGLVAQATS